MVINIEATDTKPRLVEAAQILVSNAALRTTTREKDPENLEEKLFSLIDNREEEKLAAFLETVEGYYEGQIDQGTLANAKGELRFLFTFEVSSGLSILRYYLVNTLNSVAYQ